MRRLNENKGKIISQNNYIPNISRENKLNREPSNKNLNKEPNLEKRDNTPPHNVKLNLKRPSSANMLRNKSKDRSTSNPDDISDLLFNSNDDQKALVTKNFKLREIVVHASNKLSEVLKKYNDREEEYKQEKESIFAELDKITGNYKMYAESYKNYHNLEEQFKNMQNDYNHNYKVLINYQESITIFLQDYMELFKVITAFLSEKYNRNNPLTFLSDIKDLILENLGKYKNTIDVLNFREIFDEYMNLLGTYNPLHHHNNEKEIIRPNSNMNVNSKFSPMDNDLQINKRQNNTIDVNSTSNVLKRERDPQNSSKGKDLYNYPMQKGKSQSSRNASPSTRKSPQTLRKNSKDIDTLDINTNTKNKQIEMMESNIKNYFDQANTKNEMKEGYQDSAKLKNNSKDLFNTSGISNVFEKNTSKREFSFENEKVKNRYENEDNNISLLREKKMIGRAMCDYKKNKVCFILKLSIL
jgi:hypothetical protein